MSDIEKVTNRTNKKWKTQMYMFMMQNEICHRNTIFATNVTEGYFRVQYLLSEGSYDVHTTVMMDIPSL